MDILASEQRYERMSRIRGKNSKPDLLVRRIAHALEYRCRLRLRRCGDLPACRLLAT